MGEGDVEMPASTPGITMAKSTIELQGERVEPSNAGFAKICVSRDGPPAVDDTRDLLAFTQVEFLVSEAMPTIDISIARRGPATAALEVGWVTENANISEASYVEQSGTVSFAPGVKKVTTTLQVIDNPQWSTEAFQYVKLLEPRGNAVLGELCKTTIVILNDDPFPQGVEDTTDQVATIKGFIHHNLTDLWAESKKGFILRLFPGIHFFTNTMLTLELIGLFKSAVDPTKGGKDKNCCKAPISCISGAGVTGKPSADFPFMANWTTAFETDFCEVVVADWDWTYLYILAFLFIVNFGLSHWTDNQFRKLKLGGKATINLRVNMMTQMLNFTPDACEDFPTGKVSKVMESQVQNAIATTWAAVFKLEAALFQLLCQTIILIYLQFLRMDGHGEFVFDPSDATILKDALIIVCIPVAMILFDTGLLAALIKKQSQLSIEEMNLSDEWSSFLIESANMRQLVTTFRKGFPVALQFKAKHKAANGKKFQATMFEVESGYKAKWFPTLLGIFFMVYGGLAVFSGDMTVAVFVAAYGTCNAFGGTLSSIFEAIFAMGEGYASIQKISDLLNAPTKRRAMLTGQQRRAKLLGEFEALHGAVNEDNIFMSSVTYMYPGKSVTALPPLSLEIEAGQVIAISAGPALGKTTLLRLLGRQFIPTKGFITYPGRWRVRFAEGLPRLFDGSVMHNLTFGNQFQHTEEEIWSLCEQIGLSSELIGQPELDVGTMGEKLALSDRISISIIRALLSSVDLLLLANALDGLGEAHAFRVMGVLHELVEFRGLPCLKSEMERTPTHLKKKKTVFLSTKLPLVEKEADAIIALKPAPDDQLVSEDELITPGFWSAPHNFRLEEEAKAS